MSRKLVDDWTRNGDMSRWSYLDRYHGVKSCLGKGLESLDSQAHRAPRSLTRFDKENVRSHDLNNMYFVGILSTSLDWVVGTEYKRLSKQGQIRF